MEILLATANKGKIRELANLLAGKDITIKSLADFSELPEIEENGQTFAENALIKARAGAAYTKLITLADDSGLEVDVLNGSPGVYSARYAGEPKDDERNTQKLLSDLQGIPQEKRTARFRCCLAIVSPPDMAVIDNLSSLAMSLAVNSESITEGTVEGIIISEKRGSGGFGYDPVFFLPDFGKTMAELSMEEKNKISHRSQAFQKAVSILDKYLAINKLGA